MHAPVASALAIALLAQVVLSSSAADALPDPKIPEESSEKILLLHMHDDAPFFSELGALTLVNKLRYAARHGYEVAAHTPVGTRGLWRPVECSNPSAVRRGATDDAKKECFAPYRDFSIDARAPTFGKIKLALAACVGRPGYWMLWSDADAMVVNQTVPLPSLIDDRFDMQLSVDWLMINAGMLLLKCTPWTDAFLRKVYSAREFDSARALDQSAFAHFIDQLPDRAEHVGYVPKHLLNTYVEEFRPGDFLLHMAGKLYEATTAGATAIALQFDALSGINDVRDVAAFFDTQYLLGMYSGVCTRPNTPDSHCKPGDPDRLKLNEPLSAMSAPNRYRHVGMRYYWLGGWADTYDAPNWNAAQKSFAPNGSRAELYIRHEAGAVELQALEKDDVEDHERYRLLQRAAQHYVAQMATRDVDSAPSKGRTDEREQATIHDEL